MRRLLPLVLLLSGCTVPGTAPPAASRWVPTPVADWQWQLSGPLDLGVDVPVYEVDGQTTTAAQVAALRARGVRVLCYVSVGTVEAFRPDAAAFPEQVQGEALVGFPDERWLDVRRLDVLAAPLRARFDACRDKGFDGVEADNVDAYANPSGFDLTADDQLAFDRWVADEVHARGLAVALKNDPEHVDELVDAFDLAVVEQCQQYDECDAWQPFVDAGKPVLAVEYADPCGPVEGFAVLRKDLDLGAGHEPCR